MTHLPPTSRRFRFLPPAKTVPLYRIRYSYWFVFSRGTALTASRGLEHAEAIKTAQALESDCLNRASSKDDYIRLWKIELAGIAPPDDGFPPRSPSRSPEPYSEALPPLGYYVSLSYHADGTHSTVYKSAIPYDHCNFETPSNYPTPAGTPVALKVTSPSFFAPPHNAHSETAILKSILPHRTIIPLLETFTTPATIDSSSHFVLVFPFCPYSLATFPPLPEGESQIYQVKRIVRDTISALVHLHKHGIIHRDIKPSNILFKHPPLTSPAFLADFGIAWSAETHASTDEPPHKKITDVGTTHYRAIEILFGYKGYGPELDLWALGCVIAECFNNKLGRGPEQWEPLFDAGDLGSELRLIASIFQTLGTPTSESWPGSSKLPDWGKIEFRDFGRKTWEGIMPSAPEEARDLVSKLLKFEASERIAAEKAYNHPLFGDMEDLQSKNVVDVTEL
ncbi:kinase-like domain-containing protein [Kalaharituber pfeilii]|nr:kinase-like domain-containing protein [Kalaharituber pfeilii]